jgi:hypothetical protein
MALGQGSMAANRGSRPTGRPARRPRNAATRPALQRSYFPLFTSTRKLGTPVKRRFRGGALEVWVVVYALMGVCVLLGALLSLGASLIVGTLVAALLVFAWVTK